MGKGSEPQVTGYRYYFSILMGLCRGPVDELVLITSDGRVAWDGEPTLSGNPLQDEARGRNRTQSEDPVGGRVGGIYKGGVLTDTSFNLQMDADGLYGGDEKEGGLSGVFDFLMGKPDQLPTAEMKKIIEPDMPGLRGIVSCFFDGQVCSNTPYPKAWRFRVRRSRKWSDRPDNIGWYPEKATIILNDGGAEVMERGVREIHAMNPAHILYECITNRDWGRGLDESVIDQPAFTYAADLLFDEKFGLCLKWSRTDGLDNFIQAVLDHVGGALYVDRITGLIVLTLIRDDYDPGELDTYDYASGLLSIGVSDSSAQDNSPNVIIVKYYSPVVDEMRSVRVHNLAAIQSVRATFAQTKEYPGLPHPDLASRVALRDLKAMSAGLKRYELTVDRRGYDIQPASVFKISDPERGLAGLVLRAVLIRDAVSTNGTLTITAVADVFGLPSTTYYVPQETTYKRPDKRALPPPFRLALNPSWRDIYRAVQGRGMNPFNDVGSSLAYLASYPNEMHSSYDLNSQRAGQPFKDFGRRKLARMGMLTAGLSPYATRLSFKGSLNSATVPQDTALYIVNEDGSVGELVRALSFPEEGVIEVLRGCVDTLPKRHAVGSLVWAYDTGLATDGETGVRGEVVSVKAITFTSGDRLNFGLAPTDQVTLAARQYQPYAGTGLRVNGVAISENTAILTDDLVFTWNHRNRITQQDFLIDYEVASIPPEPDTTYEVGVYRTDGSIVRSLVTTQDQVTYPKKQIAADKMGGDVVIRMITRRAGLQAYEIYNAERIRYKPPPAEEGYGNNYGSNYGMPAATEGVGINYGMGYGLPATSGYGVEYGRNFGK